MDNRKAGKLSLILFTIVTLLHVFTWYDIITVPAVVLSVSRWIFIAGLCVYAWFKKSLTAWIMVSMVSGVLIGYEYPAFSQNLLFLRQIFLNLVKAIVAPLLFSTLVVGIAGHSNLKQVGRLGWKSLLYFEIVTTIALAIGLIAINISQAGVGIIQPEILEKLPETKALSWSEHIIDVFPSNFIKAIYDGKVLQIVVFSVLFAIGLAMLKEDKKRPMLRACESLSEAMFKFTNIIMYFAPIGIGAAMAVTVGHLGIGVLENLLKLVLTLICSADRILIWRVVARGFDHQDTGKEIYPGYQGTCFDSFCNDQFRFGFTQGLGEYGKIWCAPQNSFICHTNGLYI